MPVFEKYEQSFFEESKTLFTQPADSNNPLNQRYLLFIDEAGRGPLFGPVTVAAIAIAEKDLPALYSSSLAKRVQDSKKLSEIKRRQLYQEISSAFHYNISHISVNFIDMYNINRAIEYGVYRNYFALRKKLPESAKITGIVMDGNYRFNFKHKRMKRSTVLPGFSSLVKGDQKCLSIAMASILAKTARDNLIVKNSERYSDYGIAKHKGYGTAAHRSVIKQKGKTRLHRKSFRC